MKGNKILLTKAGINVMILQMQQNLSRAKFNGSRVLGCDKYVGPCRLYSTGNVSLSRTLLNQGFLFVKCFATLQEGTQCSVDIPNYSPTTTYVMSFVGF
jgi:hypothetical protein